MSDDAKVAQAAEDKDSSTLEAKVESKMAELRGENEDVDDSDEVVVSDEEKETVKDSKPDDAEKESDANLPMLPSGHRRAALARGYTSEEIDFYLQSNPEDATARFKEIFGEWQEENSRWSQRGRQLIQADGTPEKKPPVKEGEFQPVPHADIKALVEKHGGEYEDLIKDLVAPLNAGIDRINSMGEGLTKSQEFIDSNEEKALATIVDNFLGSKEMSSFADTYGKDVATATEEQVKNRMELFGEADNLIAGAKAHGKSITVEDALNRAHLILSQGTRDEVIRQQIRDSMKKRTKTIKSSHKADSPAKTNEPISEEELEKRTEARMRELKNK